MMNPRELWRCRPTFFRLVLLLVFSAVALAEKPPAASIPAEPADLPASRPPSLRKVEVLHQNVPQYGKAEIRADIVWAGRSPFNPDEIRVEALLVSPSGAKKTAPAFFYGPKTTGLEGDEWRVRFSPDEPGEWEGRLAVSWPGGGKDSKSFDFECTLPAMPVPARVSVKDPSCFELADGTFFYPLGHNVCWGSLKDYEAHFLKMHQNGENWARVWISPSNADIEWCGNPDSGGPGHRKLENAAKLDEIVELAEAFGIYLQMVLHTHSEMDSGWRDHPCNQERGGPCAQPQDFFTNAEALQLERNRIRYIIARWGYSSRIMAWELFDEADRTDGFDPKTDAAWQEAMARYIRGIDPHGRMITTSYAGGSHAEVFALPEIDFTQAHIYGEAIIDRFIEEMRAFSEFKKPYFAGEFGRTAQDGADGPDARGMFLHTGIWAQFMMPSGGNAMSWRWHDWIKPSNLFYRFGALNAFRTGIDRRGEKWNWQYGRLTKDPYSPRVLSMASPRTVMFWIYDPKILPYRETMPERIPEIEGGITIEHLSPGKWSVEKWEPFNSHVLSRAVPRADETSEDGRMMIRIHASGPDCAFKLQLSSNDKTDENRLPALMLEPW